VAPANENPAAIEARGVPEVDQAARRVTSERSLSSIDKQEFAAADKREFMLAGLRRANADLRSFAAAYARALVRARIGGGRP
jgi:hypothetical protein